MLFAAFNIPLRMLCTLTHVEKLANTASRAALLRRWRSFSGSIAPVRMQSANSPTEERFAIREDNDCRYCVPGLSGKAAYSWRDSATSAGGYSILKHPEVSASGRIPPTSVQTVRPSNPGTALTNDSLTVNPKPSFDENCTVTNAPDCNAFTSKALISLPVKQSCSARRRVTAVQPGSRLCILRASRSSSIASVCWGVKPTPMGDGSAASRSARAGDTKPECSKLAIASGIGSGANSRTSRAILFIRSKLYPLSHRR
mmetsp:Transcript_153932/g.266555  ORF Transcript_153932/g.266555 Transcript_153932/m.266555 type:complete len:257 (+) Transcript_153932:97-867(+)